jgi:hypothetical protein
MFPAVEYLFAILNINSHSELIDYFTVDTHWYKPNPLRDIYCIRTKYGFFNHYYTVHVQSFHSYTNDTLYFVCHPYVNNLLLVSLPLLIPLGELEICSETENSHCFPLH